MPDDPREGPQESKLVPFWWVKCEGVCSLGRYSTQAGIFDLYEHQERKVQVAGRSWRDEYQQNLVMNL